MCFQVHAEFDGLLQVTKHAPRRRNFITMDVCERLLVIMIAAAAAGGQVGVDADPRDERGGGPQ